MTSQTNDKVYTQENIPSLDSMTTTMHTGIAQLEDEIIMAVNSEPATVKYSVFIKNFAQMYMDGYMAAPDYVTKAWARIVPSTSIPVIVIDDITHEPITEFPPISQTPIVRKLSTMLDAPNVLAEAEVKAKQLNDSTRDKVLMARVEKIDETMDANITATDTIVDAYNVALTKAFNELEAYANPTSEVVEDESVDEDTSESKMDALSLFYAQD